MGHQPEEKPVLGHVRGANIAQNIIEECSRLEIKVLTLYAFSTENWQRSFEEVSFLMHLLRRQLVRERHQLMKNNIRFQIIGDPSKLPEQTRLEVFKTQEMTQGNNGMLLIFALNYGSRQEIVHACRAIAEKIQSGQLSPDELTEAVFAQHLQTNLIPDPDLIIRTSGEFRLSNFLMWQAAYSEILVRKTLWPDFSVAELHLCLQEYQTRTRRFGRTSENTSGNTGEMQNETNLVEI